MRLRLGLTAATLVAALWLVSSDTARAQLQQSGGPGSTVTIGTALPAGSAIIGNVRVDQTTPGTTNAVSLSHVGATTVATGNGVVSAGVQRVAIASDQTAFGVNATLQAGTAVIGVVKTVPSTTCGTTAVTQAMVAIPTSPTSVFASTTCVIVFYVNNTNASAQTVTLTDGAGTPLNIVGPAFSVPGLSNMAIPLYGIPASSGVKWTAGGTGLTGGVVGYQ